MTLRISRCQSAARIVLTVIVGLSLSAMAVAQQANPAQKTAAAAQNAQLNARALLAEMKPELRRALQEWYDSSKQIQKLHGEHCRFVYDYVFQVEKRAIGRFYYEAPSKGRIDLSPKKIDNPKFSKKHPETGQMADFSVKPETEERWICDGQQILAIDDGQKTVQQYPIPKEGQGINIMDGPLPFLFGMPPEKAVLRFQLRLESMSARYFDLLAVPRWKQDAANYRWARIRIERSTMLPMAVQMLDPAGTRETVYTFPKVEKNPKPSLLARGALFKRIFGTEDPFRPSLKGYDVQVAEVDTEPVKRQPLPAEDAVPSVIGFAHAQARQILERSGYEVKFYKGAPAVNKQLTFRVQKQEPAPRTPLKKGTLVKVTLYTEPVAQASATVPATEGPARTAAKPAGLPDVVGRPWDKAKALLVSLGYDVKVVKGRVATREADLYRVSEQSPKAGGTVSSGSTIVLKVFVKPADVAESKK